MFQIPTLYTNYQELLLDLDIFGKIVSESSVTKDELKVLLFEEYKITHPLPTLEDKRYELSDLVSSDYHITYANEIELAENEKILDLGLSNESSDDFELEGNIVVPSVLKEHINYSSNITDSIREQLIRDYITNDLEDLSEEESLQAEGVFGIVEDNSVKYEEDDSTQDFDNYDEDVYGQDSEDEEDTDSYYSSDEDVDSEDDDYYGEEDSYDNESYEEDEDDSADSDYEYEEDSEDYSDDSDYSCEKDEDDSYEEESDTDYYFSEDEEESDDDYYSGEDEEDMDDTAEQDDGNDSYTEYEEESDDDYSLDENEEDIVDYSQEEDTAESVPEFVVNDDLPEIEFIQPAPVIPTPIEINNQNKLQTDVKKEPKPVVNREEEPKDLREFLRKHPRCEVSFALQYFSRKEIEKNIMMGKVIKKGTKLHI